MQNPKSSARCAFGLGESSNSARLVSALCLALLVAACGRNEPLVSANPVAPTAPAAPTVGILTLTLSGVVAEDDRQIENAQVEVQWSCGGGCSTGRGGITDAAGRYRIAIAGLPKEGATVWATARKDGYVQQCIATATMQADASLDLRLTSIANLSAARPLSGPGSRTVSGAVFEATPTGRQPVEGASVAVYSEALYYAEAVAFTRSDPAGRYLLCGLPEGRIPALNADKQGYRVSSVSVEPGSDAIVDIQMRP